jgi:D-serine deaminase-like pyridoxal phosphate-dependent protein
MPLTPPALPGMTLDEIDTPALVVDLDAFERNLDGMAAALPPGMRLRPHAKMHKSPVVACAQVARGAVGVCCQKVSEAEIMVEGGVGDVLVTNEIWGGAKLDRLAALARRARVGVCVDHPANIRDLASAASWFGARLDVYVEIDVGAGRCGVSPGLPAVHLAEAVGGAEGLRFAGLQAYHGAAQHVRGHGERRTLIAKAAEQVRLTLDGLAGAGIACPVVTGGGTGTWEFEAGSGLWTELQVGSYAFMDADYARNLDREGREGGRFEHALFVLATVMHRRGATHAVVDAGSKAFNFDDGPPLCRNPAIRYVGKSDEHGVLLVPEGAVAPGERLFFIPSHCDPTIALHDWYVCVRGLSRGAPRVEAIWPVAARGALF